jgi:hypothetical protein
MCMILIKTDTLMLKVIAQKYEFLNTRYSTTETIDLTQAQLLVCINRRKVMSSET